MGKKSSHKKQNHKAQPNKAQPQAAAPRKTMELASLQGGVAPSRPQEAKQQMGFGDQTRFIRSDIRRIVLLLCSVLVLLVVAMVWNAKGATLFNAGKHIASFMRLQQ